MWSDLTHTDFKSTMLLLWDESIWDVWQKNTFEYINVVGKQASGFS